MKEVHFKMWKFMLSWRDNWYYYDNCAFFKTRYLKYKYILILAARVTLPCLLIKKQQILQHSNYEKKSGSNWSTNPSFTVHHSSVSISQSIWFKLTVRRESHDDIALIDRLQILTAEVELPDLVPIMRHGLLFLVLAKGVLVDVQQKLGRRPPDLGRPADGAPRTFRHSQQVQDLVLHLAFLTLVHHAVDYRLIEAVVHVQTADPLGATDAQVADDRCEDQQDGEGLDWHDDDRGTTGIS